MQLAAAQTWGARLPRAPAVTPAAPQRLQHRLGLAASRCPAAAAGGAAHAAAAAVEAPQQLQEAEPEELMLSFSMDSGSDDDLQLASKPRRRGAGAASGGSSEWRRRGQPLDQYRAVPVTVAGERYESLMDLRYKMRSLQRELLGQADEVEVPRSSPHFEIIQALFRRHPSYRTKVQEPIQSFYVVRNPYVNSGYGCEFQYVDARGPEYRSDFSLLKCTRPRPKLRRRNLLVEACTSAIAPQLEAAAAAAPRNPAGQRCCERCGSDFKVEVIYTSWPLSNLIQKFEAEAAPRRTPAKFAKPPADAGCQLAQFRLNSEADSAWAAAWEQYHQQQARLEALCKHCANRQADAARQQQQLERRSRQRGGRRGQA
ncbi:DUF3223 domain-containing [Chlorella sorokiniana]|uniref:DUF3223 domain-containing n=1 Tax=Chlorella sorokiniana TaxID=3076 RepID=A0A2P6TXF8_CHLSO|nr:DUF3223 domain-containing [Chlorella sorokiniana]|eukprot:PRW58741.1 DUF3223 domain-containing [Chlorella sorokiniana]